MWNVPRGLVLVLSVSICGLSRADQALAAEAATFQTDQFSPNITIVGPEEYKNPLGGTFRSWKIRSWIDKKTLTVESQLYVDIRYFGDWRFYETATTDAAEVLDLVSIDRQVRDCSGICSFSEIVGIALPTETLSSHVAEGLPLKLAAKSGDSIIITITPEQVQAQLASIAQVRPPLPGPASNVPMGKPRLGIVFAMLDAKALSAQHISSDHGAMVVNVADGSPAQKAGITPGDIILSFDGLSVTSTAMLAAATASKLSGSTARVHLWRGGHEMDVSVQS